jgi:hypothetical protein
MENDGFTINHLPFDILSFGEDQARVSDSIELVNEK